MKHNQFNQANSDQKELNKNRYKTKLLASTHHSQAKEQGQETTTKLKKTYVFFPLSKIAIMDKTFNGLQRYKESVNHVRMPSTLCSLGKILSQSSVQKIFSLETNTFYKSSLRKLTKRNYFSKIT